MANRDILVDASFLIALAYEHDKNYVVAIEFAAESRGLLIPEVVLPEAFFNLRVLGGRAAVEKFRDFLIKNVSQFVSLTTSDITRAFEVMEDLSGC